MSFEPRSPHRDALLQALANASSAASSLQRQAGELLQNGNHTREVATILHTVVERAPNDSGLSAGTWTQLTSGWQAYADRAIAVSQSLASAPLLSATSQSADLTTSFTTVEFSGWLGASVTPEIRRLSTLLTRPHLLTQIRTTITSLNLDVAYRGTRPPLVLLDEARIALERPAGEAPSPLAVLLPAREAINAILAALLTRRPVQEPASKGSAKVISIGRQLGLEGLSSDHFERLAALLEALNDDLSQSKRAALAPDALADEFHRSVAFLQAMLDSLDRSKFRT